MKRSILAVVISLFSLCIAQARVDNSPKAVGINLGLSNSVTYQHYVKYPNFAQFDVAYSVYSNIAYNMSIMGSYNIVFYSPRLTNVGSWNIYAGPGLQLSTNDKTPIATSVFCNLGIEYRFDLPLQLSLSISPTMYLFPFSNNRFLEVFTNSFLRLGVYYKF